MAEVLQLKLGFRGLECLLLRLLLAPAAATNHRSQVATFHQSTFSVLVRHSS